MGFKILVKSTGKHFLTMDTSTVTCSFSEKQHYDSSGFNESSEDLPLLTNRYRLWIQVANLPRQGLLRGGYPSTYAVVTSAATCSDQASNDNEFIDGMVTSPGIHHGQTEVIPRCCNPQYTEVFHLDYKYGTKLFFFVHIFAAPQNPSEQERKTLLGTARFEVGDILGSPSNWRARRLRKGGVVFSRLEPPSRSIATVDGTEGEEIKYLRIRFAAKNLELPRRKSLLSGSLFQSLPDLSVALSRRPDSQSRHVWIAVFRSQPVCNTLNPRWDPGSINLECLCHGDIHQQIRVSVFAVWPQRAPTLVGYCETTVRFLLEAATVRRENELAMAREELPSPKSYNEEGCQFILQQSESKAKDVGRLTVLEADIVTLDESGNFSECGAFAQQSSEEPVDLVHVQVYSPVQIGVDTEQSMRLQQQAFQELLLRNECQFNFCVAIDFTSSNGDPINDESSLHFQSESLNDYEETIMAVGQAIEGYSGDRSCSVWGFGAKFGDGVVRHLFQCGPNPQVKGVNNILEAYRSIFSSGFTMSGPTVFLKVIQAAAMQAKAHHQARITGRESAMIYTVLLVITDGIMDDFDETYRKIEVYKELPLSIIFVGVGRSDFSTLQRICQLCSTNTTFVEFRSKESPSEFALGALANLPRQVVAYVNR